MATNCNIFLLKINFKPALRYNLFNYKKCNIRVLKYTICDRF